MDLTIILAILSFFVIVASGFAFYFASKGNSDDKPQRDAGARPVQNQGRDAPGGRRAQMLRNRNVRARRNVEEEAEPAPDDSGYEEAQKDLDKLGAKKRAKLEAKAEKKTQREAEEHSRADRKKREEQAIEERRKLEEMERALEKQREEEERKAREEKERREHEEYMRMKEAFKVEEEGYEEGDEGEQGNILQEFVEFIKEQKVVVVEDLASRFKLKTQAAIDRIKDLQQDDILTGVIDDRGKFIYVSPTEMAAVAKFIKQRGRVSIQELAEHSNQLIRLAPTQVA